jgi:hypothetical protein
MTLNGLHDHQAGALAKAVTDEYQELFHAGQLRPWGATLRDCLKNRAGFDRVLMAVAATFLTVSATSALAQADPARNSAAELAIDAAIPRPEPANVPPPTINDFKPEATASLPDAAETTEKAAQTKPADPEIKPADVVTAPAPDTGKNETSKDDTATTTPAPPPAAATATPALEPAKEPTKAASNVPPADQPVADRLREMLGAKSLRFFDRKTERAAVEKFYNGREFAPLWTQGEAVTESGKGLIARLKNAASDGLNASDYPVPDLAAATLASYLVSSGFSVMPSLARSCGTRESSGVTAGCFLVAGLNASAGPSAI